MEAGDGALRGSEVSPSSASQAAASPQSGVSDTVGGRARTPLKSHHASARTRSDVDRLQPREAGSASAVRAPATAGSAEDAGSTVTLATRG